MDDLQKWLKFYETGRTPCHKLIFQFGANPEVEDVLVAQGNNQGLMMFDDDKDAPSYRKKAPWDAGLKLIREYPRVFFTLICGVASTPKSRHRAIKRVEQALAGCKNWCWGVVKSSTAYKAVNVKPEPGVLILDKCYVAPFVKLKEHSVLLPCAAVYHNSVVGAYSILVGGSRVLGRSVVGAGTRVCCNSVVLPEGRIDRGCTIGSLQAAKRLGKDEWQDK